ncbi:MAG: hypoxanthine phosphoribosyltransferase [Candidatus Riflebacteria bacterium]|nr:hypoxanthine phosphoribosyltransferase [Candidatus Riflebacteria bacterium]
MSDIHQDISRVLISADEIQARIKVLGEEITVDYQNEDIVLVCILKGAFLFMADLCRHIRVPVNTEFMAISSYGHSTESSGVVRILKDLNESIAGRNVLIIEDIVDTGLTVSYLEQLLEARKPNSIRICTLSNKPQCHKTPVQIDYCGFILPQEFVVGFGLDYRDYYRNLPYIGVLKPEIYQK